VGIAKYGAKYGDVNQEDNNRNQMEGDEATSITPASPLQLFSQALLNTTRLICVSQCGAG
jgi:hypothetical protein